MKNKLSNIIETSYRTLYGKLFSALLKQFGVQYIKEIEDAIQNAFYKSLKSWKPNKYPDNKENWFFIVARNDLLNQIKKQNQFQPEKLLVKNIANENLNEDLRLQTILFISKSKIKSPKVKVIFILKNIFGLHVKEISDCILISQEAIYKNINRAKIKIKTISKDIMFDSAFEQVSEKEIAIVEEILYAVFNIGFDSFREKNESIINEDLCLEALALTKMLVEKYSLNSTKNMLALFCFHLARIPEKIKEGKIISFFDQDKTKWNKHFVELAFHYMEKPSTLNRYYIESLIVSKHMTTSEFNIKHWNEIVELYQMMLSHANSPILRLNLCYCLSKANRKDEAIKLLNKVEKELPQEHIYFSLVKANILDNKSEELANQALKNIKQKIRKDHIMENMLSNF